jgi:hypothetical protein
MIKRYFILFFSFTSYIYAFAQLSEPMHTYMDACITFNEGISDNFNKYKISDAIDLFKKVELAEIPSELCVAVADTVLKNEVKPKISYTAKYADYVLRNQNLIELDNISLMNKGNEDNVISIISKGIRSNSAVAYSLVGNGYCEMLVVGNPDANLDFCVTDISTGIKYIGIKENTDNVSWVTWTLPDEDTPFQFEVINKSDSNVSIVVAIN